MRQPRTFQLLVASLCALAPAHAAAVGAQEQGGSVLVSGEVTLVAESETVAVVEATYLIESTGPVVLLLADLPGQRVDDLQVRVGGELVEVGFERRSTALRQLVTRSPRAVSGPVQVDVAYRASTADPQTAYRYVLPVPEATPSGEERSVTLRMVLPQDAAFAGNAFPPLVADANQWRADLVAVPALAHVVFGDAGASLYQHRILEAAAVGVAVLAVAGGWRWQRRRGRVGQE